MSSRSASRRSSTQPPLTRDLARPRPCARASTARARSTRSSARRRCPPGMDLDGPEDRHRLRQRRRLQGGAADARRPGAEIVPIGCSPNGRNINDGCGSTRPGTAAAHGARRARRTWASPSTATAIGSSWSITSAASSTATSCCTSSPRAPGSAGTLQRPGGRHRDEQPRARARAARARASSSARAAVGDRYVLAMLRETRRRRWAARPPATSCASTRPPPATAWSAPCRCSPS